MNTQRVCVRQSRHGAFEERRRSADANACPRSTGLDEGYRLSCLFISYDASDPAKRLIVR